MAKPKLVVDFTIQTDFSKTASFRGVSHPDLRGSLLEQLKETWARAEGAAHFSLQVVWEPDRRSVPLREAYLRAALGEFVSMEETLKRDLPGVRTRRITDSHNPLLHVVRELRNLQVHLHSAALGSKEIVMEFGGRQFDSKVWLMDDLTVLGFEQLKNAERYEAADRPRLVAWLNDAQKHWGIDDLVFRAVLAYRDEIVTAHLQPQP